VSRRSSSPDLALIALLTRTVEALTWVRPNTFEGPLGTELRDMFLEELDFHREADFTTLFRTFAKRDRLRFVTAPRVLAKLLRRRCAHHRVRGDG
jgi:predicted unusual protein kinase regulating ubiquinone biosynthesis (AarF/ABC1/UbiB family)